MMQLNADGTITMQFDQPDSLEPLVVTLRRPSFGTFKRLRVEANKILNEQKPFETEVRAKFEAMQLEIQADETLTDEEKVEQITAREQELVDTITTWVEDTTIGWWRLVLVGDDTLKRLADRDVPPVDYWPAYLMYGAEVRKINGVDMRLGSSRIAIEHWQSVPLDRGAKPHPAT